MDMRQLRYFVQIVESGSLAKASRQLYIAQPALSQQMARMEEEVGKLLLIRSFRGVIPTENGAALYQHAKFLLRQMEETIAVARQEASALHGRVTIGMGPTTVAQLGIPLLDHLAQELPGIRLNVVEGSSGQLEYMTRGGQLDLAVLFTGNAASEFNVEPLLDEELVVMLPSHSEIVPLDRNSLSLKEVSLLPLTLPSVHHNSRRRRIELEFERAGLSLDPVAEIDSLPLLMAWVHKRGGATIQPRASINMLGYEPSGWRCLRIADVTVSRPNYLYTLPAEKLSPSAAAVRDALRLVVRRMVESGVWDGVSIPKRQEQPTISTKAPRL